MPSCVRMSRRFGGSFSTCQIEALKFGESKHSALIFRRIGSAQRSADVFVLSLQGYTLRVSEFLFRCESLSESVWKLQSFVSVFFFLQYTSSEKILRSVGVCMILAIPRRAAFPAGTRSREDGSRLLAQI